MILIGNSTPDLYVGFVTHLPCVSYIEAIDMETAVVDWASVVDICKLSKRA